MESKDFNLGYILAKLVPAFFIGIPGIIFVFFVPALGIILLAISICLLCLRSGIEIDVANKRIRKYSALNKWKIGEWISLAAFNHILLDYTFEVKHISSRAGSHTTQLKSFELIFSNKSDDPLPFYEFTDYKTAREVRDFLVKNFNMSCEDEFVDKSNKIKTKQRPR